MRRLLIYIIGLLLIAGCGHIEQGQPTLVVEGWIDSGGHPCVQLTQNIPVPTEPMTMDDLVEYMIFFAKVRVSEGHLGPDGSFVAEGEPATLSGRVDKRYVVPYIFTCAEITGKPGKAYYLTVDFGTSHTSAVTTIPEPVAIDSLSVTPYESSDTLFTIDAHLTNPEDRRCLYRAFVRTEGESEVYTNSFMSSYDSDASRDRHICLHVNRSITLNISDYEPYYHHGQKVHVKVGTMTEHAFNYWNDFDDASAAIRNPLFPVTTNTPSNLTDGAIGIWAGYGVSEAAVTLPE